MQFRSGMGQSRSVRGRRRPGARANGPDGTPDFCRVVSGRARSYVYRPRSPRYVFARRLQSWSIVCDGRGPSSSRLPQSRQSHWSKQPCGAGSQRTTTFTRPPAPSSRQARRSNRTRTLLRVLFLFRRESLALSARPRRFAFSDRFRSRQAPGGRRAASAPARGGSRPSPPPRDQTRRASTGCCRRERPRSSG